MACLNSYRENSRSSTKSKVENYDNDDSNEFVRQCLTNLDFLKKSQQRRDYLRIQIFCNHCLQNLLSNFRGRIIASFYRKTMPKKRVPERGRRKRNYSIKTITLKYAEAGTSGSYERKGNNFF